MLTFLLFFIYLQNSIIFILLNIVYIVTANNGHRCPTAISWSVVSGEIPCWNYEQTLIKNLPQCSPPTNDQTVTWYCPNM